MVMGEIRGLRIEKLKKEITITETKELKKN